MQTVYDSKNVYGNPAAFSSIINIGVVNGTKLLLREAERILNCNIKLHGE